MKFDTISILEIEGKFFVPDYQRGYRWGEDVVKQLLDDIKKNGEIIEYLWDTTTTKYDEKSDSVETIYDRGISNMKITTKFDENRNMIEEICECVYDRENEIYKYEYNEHGEIIMIYKEYFKNDTLLETEITKYDNGNSIEFITQEYDENGSETDNTKSVYTNDEYGNMITRAYYINGKLTSITRTEIEYYD